MALYPFNQYNIWVMVTTYVVSKQIKALETNQALGDYAFNAFNASG